jgi:hypothetical protein
MGRIQSATSILPTRSALAVIFRVFWLPSHFDTSKFGFEESKIIGHWRRNTTEKLHAVCAATAPDQYVNEQPCCHDSYVAYGAEH